MVYDSTSIKKIILPSATSHWREDCVQIGSADQAYMFPYQLLKASNLDALAMKPEINEQKIL